MISTWQEYTQLMGDDIKSILLDADVYPIRSTTDKRLLGVDPCFILERAARTLIQRRGLQSDWPRPWYNKVKAEDYHVAYETICRTIGYTAQSGVNDETDYADMPQSFDDAYYTGLTWPDYWTIQQMFDWAFGGILYKMRDFIFIREYASGDTLDAQYLGEYYSALRKLNTCRRFSTAKSSTTCSYYHTVFDGQTTSEDYTSGYERATYSDPYGTHRSNIFLLNVCGQCNGTDTYGETLRQIGQALIVSDHMPLTTSDAQSIVAKMKSRFGLESFGRTYSTTINVVGHVEFVDMNADVRWW